jgi:hypothetical protein
MTLSSERRRGDQMTAKGIYRDPVRSSHTYVVKVSGLRWLGGQYHDIFSDTSQPIVEQDVTP